MINISIKKYAICFLSAFFNRSYDKLKISQLLDLRSKIERNKKINKQVKNKNFIILWFEIEIIITNNYTRKKNKI